MIASWQGREPQALELIEDSIQEAAARGEGRAISLSEFARAVLYNGLGRYDLALAAARRVCEHDDLALLAWVSSNSSRRALAATSRPRPTPPCGDSQNAPPPSARTGHWGSKPAAEPS